MGTGYQPEKNFWVLMGTGYQPDEKLWVPMGTGYRPDKNYGYRWCRVPARKKFWVPMGTGYRENFHLCRSLVGPPLM